MTLKQSRPSQRRSAEKGKRKGEGRGPTNIRGQHRRHLRVLRKEECFSPSSHIFVHCQFDNHPRSVSKIPFPVFLLFRILGSHWEPLVQRAYLFQEDKCFWQLPSFKRYCLCCKPPTYHFWTQHAVIWLWHSDVQTFPRGIYPVVPLLRGGYMCFLFVPSISCLIKFHPSDLKCFLRWVLDRKLGCLA